MRKYNFRDWFDIKRTPRDVSIVKRKYVQLQAKNKVQIGRLVRKIRY